MDPLAQLAHLSLNDESKIPLHNLVGNDEYYERVEEQLINPNEIDDMGYSLLQVAAWSLENNPRIVQLLIGRGACVDEGNSSNYTPLHFAVAHRQRQTVLSLIEAGASVNSRDFFGRSVLHFAIVTCSWWYPPIPKLNLRCDMWIVERLLSHPNIRLNPVDDGGNTPLMFAVRMKNWEAVQRLLKKGADPNIPNWNNQTTLHCAFSTQYHNYRVAFALLTNGAGIYCEDSSQQTPVDVLVHSVSSYKTLVFAKHVVWLIALRYHVRDSLKLKLQGLPDLSVYFEGCCREVSLMRKQIIYNKFTLHDFLLGCFQSRFVDSESDIYASVIEALSCGSYIMYLFYIDTMSAF